MMKKTFILSLALSAAFTLSACGFTPMHAPQIGADGAAFKNIQIDVTDSQDIANQEGTFWIQQALYDRLGTQGRTHVLSVTPEFNRSGLGVSAEDIATRFELRVSLNYRLIDSKTGDVLDSGSLSTSSTFGAPNDPYGRSVSEQTATQNISKDAVDRLIIKLAAYYANTDKT